MCLGPKHLLIQSNGTMYILNSMFSLLLKNIIIFIIFHMIEMIEKLLNLADGIKISTSYYEMFFGIWINTIYVSYFVFKGL